MPQRPMPPAMAGRARRVALALAICTGAGGSPGLAAGPVPLASPSRGPALVTPIAVFGTDDRVLLPDRYKGLRGAIGLLINSKARTVCSAFCVADNVVATAAHCLFYGEGQKRPSLTDYAFTRQPRSLKNRVQIAGHATGSVPQNVLAGTLRLSVRPPIEATGDWALARLAEPACQGNVLPVRPIAPEQITALGEKGALYQVAYHRDFGNWRLAYSKPCESPRNYTGAPWESIAPDFSEPAHLILHTCDTGGASSGSPLLTDGPRGPEVVGINVGTYVQARVVMQRGHVVRRLKEEAVANTGVGAGAFSPALDALRGAVVLATGTPVRELQQRLKMLDLYRGALDGTYGVELRRAILAFERATGAPPAGLASDALLRQLEGPPPNTMRRTSSPTDGPHGPR